MSTTRKTPWLLMILCTVVLAAASVAGTWYYVTRMETASAPADQPPAAPELVTIPPLTVNLQNPQHEQRLLYIGFSITVGDKATQAFLQPYVPQIRSQLFKLLGEQDSTALMTSQGKSVLAAKVLELVKRPLTTPQPELSILDVLYTDFIVQ